MWKYIIIGALVLLALATWVFKANYEAMVVPSGEVEALNTNFKDAVKVNKDIDQARTATAWAVERAKWLESEKERYNTLRDESKEKTRQIRATHEERKNHLNDISGSIKKIQADMDQALKDAAEVVGADASAGEAEIKKKVMALVEGNIQLQREVAKEEATIAALKARSTDLNQQIADARQLSKDRNARISPADLECHVITADPQWDIIILDAGVDKGIVIGSRLAVMRGDQKICELNVTLVETNRSNCDIVYSTMMTGERVKVGDRVISVRNNK